MIYVIYIVGIENFKLQLDKLSKTHRSLLIHKIYYNLVRILVILSISGQL